LVQEDVARAAQARSAEEAPFSAASEARVAELVLGERRHGF
jgi:hypothetical protein